MSHPFLPKVYVSSKVTWAAQWRATRQVWAGAAEIISTWIDFPSEPADVLAYREAWPQWIEEISNCDVLLAYHEEHEVWKGAYIEVGAALALGRPVVLFGHPPGSWIHHPLVTRYDWDFRGWGDLQAIMTALK